MQTLACCESSTLDIHETYGLCRISDILMGSNQSGSTSHRGIHFIICINIICFICQRHDFCIIEELCPFLRNNALSIGIHFFKCYNHFAVKVACVICEYNVYGAFFSLSCKFSLSYDAFDLAHVHSLIAVLNLCIITDVKCSGQGVCLANGHIAVIYSVSECYFVACLGVVHAVFSNKFGINLRNVYHLVFVRIVTVLCSNLPFLFFGCTFIHDLVNHDVPAAKFGSVNTVKYHNFSTFRIFDYCCNRISVSIKDRPCHAVIINPVYAAFQLVRNITLHIGEFNALVNRLVSCCGKFFAVCICIDRIGVNFNIGLFGFFVHYILYDHALVDIVQVILTSEESAVLVNLFRCYKDLSVTVCGVNSERHLKLS